MGKVRAGRRLKKRAWGRRLGDNLPTANVRSFVEEGSGLETTQDDIWQITAFVLNSPHVQRNEFYQMRAAETTLIVGEDEEVNAFATDGALELDDDSLEPPFIVYLAGAANATRLASYAMALETGGGEGHGASLLPVIRALGESVVDNDGELGAGQLERIARETGLNDAIQDPHVQRRANSFAAAMNLGVIAHELGHLALGHTLGEDLSYEVSRNQEREADSFASSVVTTSPFGDYLVAGSIVWWTILVWVGNAANQTEVTTHPMSAERLQNFIRDNETQAADLGFTADSILEYLP